MTCPGSVSYGTQACLPPSPSASSNPSPLGNTKLRVQLKTNLKLKNKINKRGDSGSLSKPKETQFTGSTKGYCSVINLFCILHWFVFTQGLVL